jgi:hypothetical protein
MYTYIKIPASNSLSGIMDMFNVSSYWRTIKNKIADLQELGYQISLYQQKLGVAHTRLMNQGRVDLAKQLQGEIDKAEDDLKKWWKVKGYIDTYLPQWVQIDQSIKVAPTSGVGAIPIVLAGMALTALAYVVNTGMALLQDYQFKKHLTSAVIEGKVTSGQAADILSVPSTEGAVEKIIGKVGAGVGFGLPIALLIGGGLYLAMSTGMLRGLFGGGTAKVGG